MRIERTSGTIRGWRLVACLMVCAAGLACNDTEDGYVGLRTSTFHCAGAPLTKASPQSPSPIALICGTEVDVDERQITLAFLGPSLTAVNDIKGIHFDVVYPRDQYEYVPGSVTIVPDNFLTWGGGVCTSNVCSAPSQSVGKGCVNDKACNVPGVVAPILTATETLDPPADPMMPNIVQGRLRIAIDRPAGTGGVASTIGGTRQILRFVLRATSLTAPTDPTLLRFQNQSVVNSNDVPLTTLQVVFVNQLFLWVQ